jgi:hypothetical protein
VWPHDHARTKITLALRVDIWKGDVPLEVVLQTLDGKRFDEAVATNAALDRVLPVPEDLSFPMLRFVDPHGSTILNGSQMCGFLPEWDRLVHMVDDQCARKFLLRVREMAEKCKKEPHTSSGSLAIESS